MKYLLLAIMIFFISCSVEPKDEKINIIIGSDGWEVTYRVVCDSVWMETKTVCYFWVNGTKNKIINDNIKLSYNP